MVCIQHNVHFWLMLRMCTLWKTMSHPKHWALFILHLNRLLCCRASDQCTQMVKIVWSLSELRKGCVMMWHQARRMTQRSYDASVLQESRRDGVWFPLIRHSTNSIHQACCDWISQALLWPCADMWGKSDMNGTDTFKLICIFLKDLQYIWDHSTAGW